MRIIGFIVTLLGGFMVLGGIHAAITKYDLSSTSDFSKSVGGLSCSLLFMGLGLALYKTGKKRAPVRRSGSWWLMAVLVGAACIGAAVLFVTLAFYGRGGNPTEQGVSFAGPRKWRQLATDKPQTIGWYVSPDSRRPNPVAMVMVDVGIAVDPTVELAAERAAKSWGGVVFDQPTELDGVRALRVRVQHTGNAMKPVEAVVALREGKLYLVMGGVSDGRSVVDEVEQVRQSWKWLDQ